MAKDEGDVDLELDPPEDEQQDQEQDDEQQDQESEQESDADQQQDTQAQDRQQQDDRQPSRAQRRIQAQQDRQAELERQNAELSRRIDDLIRSQARPQGETPEQRTQRLALLTPEERIREDLADAERRHGQQLAGLQFQVLDRSDKAAFEAKATIDPLYAKWAPKVEAELAAMRTKGQNVEREVLMDYLIGRNARENRQKVAGRQRMEAGRRVAAASTRPGSSRSDVQPQRRQGSSLEKRLENVPL